MSAMGQNFGGSFLSAFLQVAFDRFASSELLDFILQWDIDMDEVESLKRTSAMIQALSDEAEMKQFTNVAVKLWLDHLKQLLYDAEDILDDYATELLRLKLKSAHQTQQVRNPSVPLTPSITESSVSSWLNSGMESAVKGFNETLEGIKGIGPKLNNIAEELQGIKRFRSRVKDINQRLKSVAQEGVALGLNSNMGFGSSRPGVFSQRPPTSSLVNKYKVFGRQEDMEKIVGWLLSSDHEDGFSVLPIVGMGGSGKTTLAQLVYNDEKVKKHFHLKAWVYVSEDFDVVRLTKEILESATGSSLPTNSLNLLQVKLQEALIEKRFLLVLDDVWNENYEKWDALSTAFAFGKPGSKILITTRNKGVASIVRSIPNDYSLNGLSDEACFELVRRHAFNDENSSDAYQKLKVFGHEIVKKCKGLPLAVKTLASLLRGKRESSQWRAILENEIWDLRENEILPSLMLSYHHLPPVLKRCFAYCALFPKEYVYSKMELVIFWMAEGIVQPKEGRKRIEDIGAEYFDELVMRSFFELSNSFRPLVAGPSFIDLSKEFHKRSFFESSNNIGSGFVMHDLIHDLAQFVSGGIYCRREYDKPSQVLRTTRHLSYVMDSYDVDATESEAMTNLRTVITLNDIGGSPRYFFPAMQFHFRFRFLRVLRFRNCFNCELPDSIGKLKHLRVLDLSFSDIVRLPNSFGSLYNLQALVLFGCGRLRQLPEDMGNLINLRYLVLPAHLGFHEIPLGVANLTSLQLLTSLDVEPKKKLSQLHGTLDNSNLEDVGNNGTEAMVAKVHLLGLRLRNLTSLRSLRITNCKNLESLSKELHTLTSLRRLVMGSCHALVSFQETRLPAGLQELEIFDCENLESLPKDLCTLTSLQEFVIDSCPALVSFQETRLPIVLQELKIFNCENLESLPKELHTLMSLQEFVIKSCPGLVSFWKTGLPTVLEELEISNCKNLESLPMGLLHGLTYLRRLEIKDCPTLGSFPDMGSSTSLRVVSILNCGKLNSFPKGLHKLINLEKLEIVECFFLMECKNLEALHTLGLHNLTSLSYLTIGGCPSLVSIPKDVLPTNLRDLYIKNCAILESLHDGLSYLTSLKHLEIQNCPMLIQQYRKTEGEEWSKIAQIPKVIIDGVWQ